MTLDDFDLSTQEGYRAAMTWAFESNDIGRLNLICGRQHSLLRAQQFATELTSACAEIDRLQTENAALRAAGEQQNQSIREAMTPDEVYEARWAWLNAEKRAALTRADRGGPR